jgi:hypothetical protein
VLTVFCQVFNASQRALANPSTPSSTTAAAASFALSAAAAPAQSSVVFALRIHARGRRSARTPAARPRRSGASRSGNRPVLRDLAKPAVRSKAVNMLLLGVAEHALHVLAHREVQHDKTLCSSNDSGTRTTRPLPSTISIGGRCSSGTAESSTKLIDPGAGTGLASRAA